VDPATHLFRRSDRPHNTGPLAAELAAAGHDPAAEESDGGGAAYIAFGTGPCSLPCPRSLHAASRGPSTLA
jgi:hypothetical protein